MVKYAKNLIQNGETQRNSWGTQKKRMKSWVRIDPWCFINEQTILYITGLFGPMVYSECTKLYFSVHKRTFIFSGNMKGCHIDKAMLFCASSM